MRITVHIERRPDIADPEGSTISRSLSDLGYTEVVAVRTGRTLHLEVDDTDPETVRRRVDEMCQRLLANPVIEDYSIEIHESEDQKAGAGSEAP